MSSSVMGWIWPDRWGIRIPHPASQAAVPGEERGQRKPKVLYARENTRETT